MDTKIPNLTNADPKTDMMLAMAVQQGYVPATCYLAGIVVMGLMNRGEDPCAGCNLDRARCHGRPHRQTP